MANNEHTELTELRFILESEMTEDELERFVTDMTEEMRNHLVDGEKILLGYYSDKYSYETRKQLKDLGED